ncbi:MAG: trehalose-phosphatase [Chloroflexi bacterium]|nr:trehalose-phosphatase [Chloroflexota bacterium]
MSEQAFEVARALGDKVAGGGRLWLFLDYDGTLAEFAPTPDTILPDEELIDLLTRLANYPDHLRVVIMSGRRYKHIEALLPVRGILLAGTYGIEFKTWEGEQVRLIDFESERPFLDQVKKHWKSIVEANPRVYLEDKGYSLALHARRLSDQEARKVIDDAKQYARDVVARGTFRMMGGYKFLEVAPTIANKGQSVATLLKRFPWPNADLVFFGDDDKDEEAFQVIKKHGGTAILAGPARPTLADWRVDGPAQVREWLCIFLERLDERAAEQQDQAHLTNSA